LHPPQNEAETVQVTVLSDSGKENRNDLVVREHTLSIILNGEKFFTLICTPKDLPALAVGHLFTQGFISGVDVIEEVQERSANTSVSIKIKREKETDNAAILPPDGIVPVAVSLDGLRLRKVGSDLTVSSQGITQLAVKTEVHCKIFRRTGGTHACALSDTEGFFAFSEDIGRHNAIDRVIGRCLLDGIPLDTAVMFTTGRVSSSILIKAVRARIPVLVSRSAPSFEAIGLARSYGVTLAGFVREGRMNVYANGHRID
jgi:FdhD protein